MGIATLTKSAQLLSEKLHILTEDELKELHKVLLNITNDFAEVCEENGIKWSLSGGSILGAVRHKGFIPWDDDIDIVMFREDFEKFKKIFPDKYSKLYELKLPGDKEYLYHFPKICKKNTTAQSIQSSDVKENVSVDIFIIENTYNNSILKGLHGVLCTFFLMVDSFLRMQKCEKNLFKYGAQSKELCNAVKKRVFFAKFFNFLSIEKWLFLSDKVFSMCKNTSSKKVVIPSGINHFFGEIFEREKLNKMTLCDFETEKYYIHENYDYYLKIRYGENYMIPPMDDEKEHHVFIEFDLNK